jgi:N-acetylneuraminic acid mutarotase
VSSNTPRERINSAFERELSDSPTPGGLRARAIQAATEAPQREGFSRAPQLLAIVAALLAVALIITLVEGNRLLRSVPGIGLPRATVARTASPSPPSPSPSPALVVTAGTWTVEPSLPTPMERFTATVLADGKVLVAGGEVTTETGGTAIARAWVFDPATGTYAPAGSMSIARAGHTATVLPSGKVLVAGGFTQGGYAALRSAEIFDPGTRAWTSAAPMHDARTHHAAVLLSNGKVLVTGGGAYPPVGISPHGSAPATLPAEIYDPATDTWSVVAKPSLDRPVSPTATLLKDGRVLVVGGQYMLNSPDEAAENSEIYDPRTDRWTATAPETRFGARQFQTATLLPTGNVLIAGGWVDTQPTSSAVLYDPARNSWSSVSNMTDSRCGASATLLKDGRVLVAGGGCGFTGNDGRNTSEQFDRTGRWQAAGSLAAPRGFMVSVLLPDGTVLAMGGITAGGTLSSAVERFEG